VVLPGRRQVLAAYRADAAWASVPGGEGTWRWLLPGGQRGLSAAAAGARRPHRGHRRLAACPQTWPALPPASAAARDAGQVPCCPGLAPSRIRAGARTVSRLMPATGPGGMRYLARHLTIARLPRPGRRERGMIPARPSPAPSPPWPGSGGAAPGHPRSCRHGLAGLALAGCQCLLRAAVSPHRASEPCPDFFESWRSSWSPVTESNRRLSPYHGRLPDTSRLRAHSGMSMNSDVASSHGQVGPECVRAGRGHAVSEALPLSSLPNIYG
jgi:hypothetical protein